jgi:hypothetical protein
MTARGAGGLRGALVAAQVAALACVPGAVGAQQARGHVSSTARFWQVRPLVRDTVPRDSLTSGVGGRLEFDGRPVDCAPADGPCTLLSQGDRSAAVGVTHDVSFTAWDLGVRGLSATGLLRARWDAGGDLALPRTDDHFDAILAYLELQRGLLRARAGRLRALGGLGSSGYDGVEIRVDPVRRLSATAYGGRSLARGLEEPRDEILGGVDDFAPRRDAYLVGGSVGLQAGPDAALTARYQREILSDRSVLLSERASLDLWARAPGGVSVTGALDYDFGSGRVGKGSLAVARSIPRAGLRVVATGRRYVPYFELWTIWGFFSPVAYHEGELAATWAGPGDTRLTAAAGYRRYEDTEAPIIFDPLEDDALRLALSGATSWGRDWSATATYAWENGVGAFRSAGSARVAWRPLEELVVALRAAAFQQIREFRVGEGVVWSGGADVAWSITPTTELTAGLDAYRQTFENRPAAFDWTQLRGWSALRVRFGEDPGARPYGAGRPRLPPRPASEEDQG